MRLAVHQLPNSPRPLNAQPASRPAPPPGTREALGVIAGLGCPVAFRLAALPPQLLHPSVDRGEVVSSTRSRQCGPDQNSGSAVWQHGDA